MTDWLHVVLPEPPSANRYWRAWRGRLVRSPAANAYATAVGMLVRARRTGCTKKTIAVTLHWYRGRRSGDLDNRAKVVLDALQGAAYERDSQVVELHMYRHDDANKPRMEVVVREVATPGQWNGETMAAVA